MKIGSYVLSLIFLMLMASPSLAVVDLKNSNYSEAFVDVEIDGSYLNVGRYYNSRSIYDGIFGYGWCSDFETTLKQTSPSTVSKVYCGAGEEEAFKSLGSHPSQLDYAELITTTMERIKVPFSDMVGLKNELAVNPGLANRWAEFLGLLGPDLIPGVYESVLGRVTVSRTEAHEIRKDGTEYWFDVSGRLTGARQPSGVKYTILRSGSSWAIRSDDAQLLLEMTESGSGKVGRITDGKNALAEYTYAEGNLVAVKNYWKNTYTYVYDGDHNLQRINFPDGTHKTITYNRKMDWVLSFQDRSVGKSICVESYFYSMDGIFTPDNNLKILIGNTLDRLDGSSAILKPTLHEAYESAAVKICDGAITNYTVWAFRHGYRDDGSKYLNAELTIHGNEVGAYRFDPSGQLAFYSSNESVTAVAQSEGGEVQTSELQILKRMPQRGCRNYSPATGWPRLSGLPKVVSIEAIFGGDSTANDVHLGCRLDALIVKVDGERTLLNYHWNDLNGDLEYVSVDGGKFATSKALAGVDRLFTWTPACLKTESSDSQIVAAAIEKAIKTGACSRSEVAIALAGLELEYEYLKELQPKANDPIQTEKIEVPKVLSFEADKRFKAAN